MNDQERYLFDLKGYLVVPDALTQEQVASLNGVLDEHIATECPRKICARIGLARCLIGGRAIET